MAGVSLPARTSPGGKDRTLTEAPTRRGVARSPTAALLIRSDDEAAQARVVAGGPYPAGLAIFVGGLRWAGVRWGLRRVPAGLADAGFDGTVVYWQWHGPVAGVFCLPIYRNRHGIEREARRLARFLGDWRRAHPDAPLYVLGCSAGGYVALRGLELLGEGMSVTAAALLSAAVDPARDLRVAAGHVAGPLVNSSSPLDCVVLGLGTCLLGTADGRHGPAAGMVGLRRAAAPPGKVVEIRWRPRMMLAGRFGGHSSCTPRRYIARYIAPAMGIRRATP